MSLPTVQSTHRSGHAVWARCRECDRARELDLAALTVAGRGDVPLVELPLLCECGCRDVSITVAGSGTYGYPR